MASHTRSLWLLSLLLLLSASCTYDATSLADLRCQPGETGQGDRTCVDGIWVSMDMAPDLPCVPETAPDFCGRLGAQCGSVQGVDNCGNQRAETCPACTEGSTCDENNKCACVPEDLETFCTRNMATCGFVTQPDNCGVMQTDIPCGSLDCDDPELECSPDNTCVCSPESDETLCVLANANCGTINATDRCGGNRMAINCGSCPNGEVCEDATNKCPTCTPPTAQVLCEANGLACGTHMVSDTCDSMVEVDCTAAIGCNDGRDCDAQGVCQCPTPMCLNGQECGTVTNACGNSATCGTCGTDQICQNNACACPKPVCPVNSECGTLTNACGESTNCGTCADNDDMCVNNFCVCQREDATSVCQREAMNSGVECGAVSVQDNCGVTVSIDCTPILQPGCGTDESCAGNACVCDTPVCGADACGTITNACGGSVNCGGCGTDESCNMNQCVCDTPVCGADACGTITNACGESVNCGGCGTDESCNANQCECNMVEASACSGVACGQVSNACANTRACPDTCSSDQTCNGNTCDCDDVMCPINACGTLTNTCGKMAVCGACGADESCNMNQCECNAPLCPAANACGDVTNACGNTTSCGTCSNGELCTNNTCGSVTITAPAKGRFGNAVAFVDENTLLIGAPEHDGTAGTKQGTVYVFTRNITTGEWSQSGTLAPPTPEAGERFGFSIASDGAHVIIGATHSDRAAAKTDAGVAFVFTHNAGVFTYQATLEATDPDGNDYFGFAVAIDNGLAAVGAPFNDQDGSNSGSVYVYELSSGTWGTGTRLTYGSLGNNDLYGYSVAVDRSRDIVWAGAPVSTENNDDRTILHKKSGGSWDVESIKDPTNSDHNGRSVAIVQGLLLTAADDFEAPTQPNDHGRVFVYSPDGTWDTRSSFDKDPNDTANYGFGWRMASDGPIVAIVAGNNTDGTSNASNVGELDVLETRTNPSMVEVGRLVGTSVPSRTTFVSTDANDRYGNAVDVVDGTNLDLLVVGAPGTDKVFLYVVP